MATTVFASNRSSVLVDGDAIEGLQSLAFRTVAEREDVRAIGASERVAVVFGLRTVHGEVSVRSANFKLDGMLKDQKAFQLVVNLKQDDSTTSPKRTMSFDGCYVEDKAFTLGAGGSVLTNYIFTATTLREE